MFFDVAVIISALLLDRLWGEPKRFHPLVGFGRYAATLEQLFYRSSVYAGAFTWFFSIVPCLLLAIAFTLLSQQMPQSVDFLSAALVLYLAIGARSLEQHAIAIYTPLKQGDLPAARRQLTYIVSRDTTDLNEHQISTAAVESVIENGADAIYAAIFWYLIAGIPGLVLYRMSNTLDAMWGYKNSRYTNFGKVAARVDDVMNYLPARITVGLYALASVCFSRESEARMVRLSRVIRCVRRQSGSWKSPNAGPVMAAGAAALGVELGGGARYHGQWQTRPALGEGGKADATTITRAIALLKGSSFIAITLLVTLAAMVEFIEF